MQATRFQVVVAFTLLSSGIALSAHEPSPSGPTRGRADLAPSVHVQQKPRISDPPPALSLAPTEKSGVLKPTVPISPPKVKTNLPTHSEAAHGAISIGGVNNPNRRVGAGINGTEFKRK